MFAAPEWLLLLLLPPLLALVAWLVGRSQKRKWSSFVADRLRDSLVKGDSPLPRWLSLAALLVGFSLLVVALARPYAISGTKSEKIRSRNILIALDLSRSMRVTDVKPDRLAQAKIIAYELMEAMPNERIGVVGFAGQAYLCAPLTIDHAAVRETLGQLDEGWVPLGGSNLTEAVEVAASTLRETGQKNNALIVLSDGEKHDKSLDDAIATARDAGMYVITIGVGTENGDYVPNPQFPNGRMVDKDGKPVISRLQPEALRTLASETGGRFAIAGSGTDLAGLVQASIKDLDTFEAKGRQRVLKTEFYQWLTLPAVLALIFSVISGTRWRKLAPHGATALFFCWACPDVQAMDAADALDALQAGRYEKAASHYRELAEKARTNGRRTGFRMGEGEAAYRAGEFEEALGAYSDALLSPRSDVVREAHVGIGNTLFQSGWKYLSEKPHAESTQTMEDFDLKVRTLLRQKLENEDSKVPVERRVKSIIQHWTDAVRHFDTVLAQAPEHATAKTNRDLTMRYLVRLKELLDEEIEKTSQSMPQGNEGAPDPNGDPDSDKPGDENSEPGDQNPDGSKDPQDRENDGEGDPQDNSQQGEQEPGDRKDKDGGEDEAPRPDETPEDKARRKLRENADTERGPLRPGQIEWRSPEKDW